LDLSESESESDDDDEFKITLPKGYSRQICETTIITHLGKTSYKNLSLLSHI